jgi:hypothetical protein
VCCLVSASISAAAISNALILWATIRYISLGSPRSLVEWGVVVLTEVLIFPHMGIGEFLLVEEMELVFDL